MVLEYLVSNHPDIRWRPSAEYLQRTEIIVLIRGPSRVDETKEDSLIYVVYRVNRLSARHLANLRDLSRVPWMYQRHRQAALALGGLVLALLVFAGFLRLDEATHGYYSGRLLGTAAGLVVLVSFAIWWSM